jgi:hypothetical protein
MRPTWRGSSDRWTGCSTIPSWPSCGSACPPTAGSSSWGAGSPPPVGPAPSSRGVPRRRLTCGRWALACLPSTASTSTAGWCCPRRSSRSSTASQALSSSNAEATIATPTPRPWPCHASWRSSPSGRGPGRGTSTCFVSSWRRSRPLPRMPTRSARSKRSAIAYVMPRPCEQRRPAPWRPSPARAMIWMGPAASSEGRSGIWQGWRASTPHSTRSPRESARYHSSWAMPRARFAATWRESRPSPAAWS